MPLSSGSRLGPYEILTPLGAGGMGEVYRAKDTRLDRTVAIKVLPSHLSENPEVRQRFEREAKTISQLSHPHICALYDVGHQDGTDYLVMEYLEGETLGDRLGRGGLPLEQVLRFGVEIALALDKAHRQGIVHRDLKPGNVMLTKSGVKLLDFGLAKVMEPPNPPGGLTALPTQANLTAEGTILGTFQYMAPEQLEGKEADARTDIFAFGVLLYEMATGRKAFAASSHASLITAIMSSDPQPISAVQPMSPPALDRVVKTCLAKDPEDRWQSAGDVARELKWIAEGSAAGGAPIAVTSRRKNRERIAWTLAALGLAAAGGMIVWRGRPDPKEPTRFTVPIPPGFRLESAAISPDGRRVVLAIQDAGGGGALLIRPLDALAAAPLGGIKRVRGASWSPDGRSILFFQARRLRRMDAGGGASQTICETGFGFGAAWSPQGTIVFSGNFGTGLLAVQATGGTPVPLTTLDAARGEVAHLFPSFLPDGRHFVFAARNADPEKTVVVLGELGSTKTRPLFRSDTTAVWAEPGYLLYASDGSLVARRFDPGRLRAADEIHLVAENVRFFPDSSDLAASASASGNLVYGIWAHGRRLVWVDRRGRELETLGETAEYTDVALSPDGRRVAVSIRDPARGQNLDVWVLEADRGVPTRVTTERTDEFGPVWTPDGRSLLYISDRAGLYDLYRRPAGGGPEQVVLKTPTDKWLSGVTADGKRALFHQTDDSTTGRDDLAAIELSGSAKPQLLIRSTQFDEQAPRASPDGRWLAFVSNESGNDEIYVQPLAGGPKRRLSSNGGFSPVWGRDGRELFYHALDGRLMTVPVRTGSSDLDLATPEPLFELASAFRSGPVGPSFDVHPDGERFLVIRPTPGSESDSLAVVLNWTAALPGAR